MTLFNHVRLLKFPQTRSILWDQTPCGEAVNINLGQSHVQVQVADTLWQNEKLFHPESHWLDLHGTLSFQHTDVGYDKILLKINDVGVGDENIQDYCLVPCRVGQDSGINKSSLHFENDCVKSKLMKSLFQFYKIKDIKPAALFPCCGVCYYVPTEEEIVVTLQLMCITLDIAFKAVPVTPVPIIHTALSRSLLLDMYQSLPTCKTGFLSMNETRHLLLVLERDPKACSLPLVGIWVSGVAVIHSTFVLAACLRYCKSLQLKHRVCAPPDSFLVVLFAPNSMKPQFYACFGSTADKQEKLRLFKGATAVSHKKVRDQLNSLSVEVLFDLLPDESLRAGNTVNDYVCTSFCEGRENRVDENEMPRPTPNPHESELQEVLSAPSVPDLSLLAESDATVRQLLLNSSPQNSNHDLSATSIQSNSRLPELLQKVQCLLKNAPQLKRQDITHQTEVSESVSLLASLENERMAVDISNHSTVVAADGTSFNLHKSDLNLTEAFSKFELDDVSIISEYENKQNVAPSSNNFISLMSDNPFCSSPANAVSPLSTVSSCSISDRDTEAFSCASLIYKTKSATGNDATCLLVKPDSKTALVGKKHDNFFTPSDDNIFQNDKPDNGNLLRTEQRQAVFKKFSSETLTRNHIETVPKTVICDGKFPSQPFSSEKCLPEIKNHTTRPNSQNTEGNHRYPSKVTETSLGSLNLTGIPLGTICDQPPSPCCTIHLDLKEYPDSVQESESGSIFPTENLTKNNVKPVKSAGAFYQKMLDKVQWMLTDATQEQHKAASSDTKDETSRHDTVTHETIADLISDRDSPFQNSCLDFVLGQHSRLLYSGSLLLPQLNYISLHKTPDVSFQIDQLARKYLNKEQYARDSPVDCCAADKQTDDITNTPLSFATHRYLEKHGLLGSLDKSKAASVVQHQACPEDETNYIGMSFATRQYLQRHDLLQAITSKGVEMESIVEDIKPNNVASDSVNILNIAKLRSQPKFF